MPSDPAEANVLYLKQNQIRRPGGSHSNNIITEDGRRVRLRPRRGRRRLLFVGGT